MKLVFDIALGIHILSVLGILGLLLSQATKSPRKLNPGVIHAGLTALVAGVVMVGLFDSVKTDEVANHAKFGIKGLVLAAILTLGYRNVKKESVTTLVWGSMLGLTILNIIIAVSW